MSLRTRWWPGSRRRTKECIAEIRHLYLDIDFDGETRLSALIASDQVPSPNIIVSTSPGKYQVLWRVEGFSFEQQESTLKLLALNFGGDPACTDCNRVVRVPGFTNRKYTPAHPVAAEYLSDSRSHPEDFHVAGAFLNAEPSLHRIAQPRTAHKHTHSEQDWSWVLSELSDGKEPGAAHGRACFASCRQAESSLLRPTHRGYGFCPSRATCRLSYRGRNHHARRVPPLRAERSIVFGSCAGNHTYGGSHDCPQVNCLTRSSKENHMPLLEVVQTRHISASVRLSDTTAIQVDQYAAFIRACADDVVEQALAYVFSKDRDFQEFLKTPEARQVASTLRVRKAPALEAAEPPAKKSASGAQSPAQTAAAVAG